MKRTFQAPFGLVHRLDLVVDSITETRLTAINREGNCVGSVTLAFEGRVCAGVSWLFVDIDHRRSGIASFLLEICIEIASAAGCETLGLVVEAANEPAIALYKKQGFIPVYEYPDKSRCMARVLPVQTMIDPRRTLEGLLLGAVVDAGGTLYVTPPNEWDRRTLRIFEDPSRGAIGITVNDPASEVWR